MLSEFCSICFIDWWVWFVCSFNEIVRWCACVFIFFWIFVLYSMKLWTVLTNINSNVINHNDANEPINQHIQCLRHNSVANWLCCRIFLSYVFYVVKLMIIFLDSVNLLCACHYHWSSADFNLIMIMWLVILSLSTVHHKILLHNKCQIYLLKYTAYWIIAVICFENKFRKTLILLSKYSEV